MKVIRKINFIVFLVSLTLFISFLIKPLRLPKSSEIVSSVVNIPPLMEEIGKEQKEEYVKNFDGTDYRIKPHYSYEIYGLVVEKYDSDSWLDVTHENDPAQTKDLCLVWGDNIKNESYREGKFKHGEFTCYYEFSRNQKNKIVGNQISNNHLVPENEALAELIKSATIGDQVYIKGKLIDYTILDESGKDLSYRKTSTSLDFTNCEVILVSDFEILKREPYYLREAKNISVKTAGVTFVLGIILLFI